MPIPVKATAYRCRYCDQGDEDSFRSLDEKEALEHEQIHREQLETEAKRKRMAHEAHAVMAREFGRDWRNWQRIFQLGLQLRFLVERQPGIMVGQSLMTLEIGMDAASAVKKVLVFNSPGSRPYRQGSYIHFPTGPAVPYIEAAFSGKPHREGKSSPEEHLPELWETLNELIRLTKPYHEETINYQDPMRGTLGNRLKYLQWSIQQDAQTWVKRGGSIIELSSPVKIGEEEEEEEAAV